MNENENSSASKNWLRNIIVALAAIALSVALVLGLQTETSGTSLVAQAEQSIAFDTALTNGKPTFAEFYADWCTSCQAMAEDLATIKNNYSDRINFVMFNVDNNKWLPEMLRYRVDGIPHFVFLDSQGQTVAESIGEQPKSILQANLDALIAHNPLPYANAKGQISNFEVPVNNSNPDDPRSHGAQVK